MAGNGVKYLDNKWTDEPDNSAPERQNGKELRAEIYKYLHNCVLTGICSHLTKRTNQNQASCELHLLSFFFNLFEKWRHYWAKNWLEITVIHWQTSIPKMMMMMIRLKTILRCCSVTNERLLIIILGIFKWWTEHKWLSRQCWWLRKKKR